MSTNIQLLSDIHLEFHKDKGKRFIESLEPSGVDVLVLAGDIATHDILLDALEAFCKKYPQVVFVAGNHEYYQSSPDEVENLLRGAEALHDNLHWLRNGMIEVEGLKFVGGTLWFPEPPPRLYTRRKGMNDYNVIKDFEPWVYEQHKECVAALNALAGQADVIVTHHLPAYECVAPRYRGNDFNHFFVHDMKPLIEKCGASAWLYGHTHTRQEHVIGDTRVICNPLGYPHEPQKGRGPYRDKLVLKVEPRS